MTNKEKILRVAENLRPENCDYLAVIGESMLVAQENTERLAFAQGNPPETLRVEKSAEDKRVMREVKCNE